MKVKELIEKLKKMDQNMEVLGGDLDNWYYDIVEIDCILVNEGRELKEVQLKKSNKFTDKCVVLKAR